MAKKGAIKVILRSTDPNSSYFYTTTKPSANKEKLSFMKYDPVVRKHVEFKEEKMR